MPDVTVTPQEFSYVDFDAERIAEVGRKALADLGYDRAMTIEVDETTPLSRVTVESSDPLVLKAESGAFEDPKHPRQLSEQHAADALGRTLLRLRDRESGGFADAPPDDELTLPQWTAWEAYIIGRLARMGYRAQRQRRLYHFRNRHGFTDTADAVFDRLWNAESLTWAEIEKACEETERAREPVEV